MTLIKGREEETFVKAKGVTKRCRRKSHQAQSSILTMQNREGRFEDAFVRRECEIRGSRYLKLYQDSSGLPSSGNNISRHSCVPNHSLTIISTLSHLT